VVRLALLVLAVAACDSAPPLPDAGPTPWRLAATLPRPRLEPGVTTLGQSVIVAGGFDTSLRDGLDITDAVDAYDAGDGTWRALPPLPVRWTHLNAATIGATLYIVGGLEGTQYVARGASFALDPVTGSWTSIAELPEPRGAAGVTTGPGRIYLLGGASTTAALATCYEYDVATDTWSALPPLPEPRSHLAAMRMTDGTLIAAGGLASLDSKDARGEVWALPPPGVADRAWIPRAPMHPAGSDAIHGGCASAVVLGQLVCAGGEAASGARTEVDSYDPYLDVWTVREPMPSPRAGTQGTAVGGRLFVPGGAQALTFDPTDSLYELAPLDTAQ
jgi:hypothetical protein